MLRRSPIRNACLVLALASPAAFAVRGKGPLSLCGTLMGQQERLEQRIGQVLPETFALSLARSRDPARILRSAALRRVAAALPHAQREAFLRMPVVFFDAAALEAQTVAREKGPQIHIRIPKSLWQSDLALVLELVERERIVSDWLYPMGAALLARYTADSRDLSEGIAAQLGRLTFLRFAAGEGLLWELARALPPERREAALAALAATAVPEEEQAPWRRILGTPTTSLKDHWNREWEHGRGNFRSSAEPWLGASLRASSHRLLNLRRFLHDQP